MELSYKEKQKLKEIELWEIEYVNKKENTIISKIGNKVNELTKPLKDKINININIDSKVNEAIQTAIMGCMNLGQDIVKFTYDKEKAIKKLNRSDVKKIDDLYKVDVTELESISKGIILENKLVGLVEGFAFGMGDLTIALSEIPVFFGVTFRVMQQIASIYGYDSENDKEKLFMIKLLSFGSALAPAGKAKVLSELIALKVGIKRYTFKQMQEMGGKYAVIMMARETAKNCGTKLTKNTLLKGIPILGGAFGATFNYGFICKIAEVTDNMYKKRFLEDKLSRNNNIYEDVTFSIVD